MDRFLKQVAKDILESHKESLAEITLLFPNQRSILFFQKYLKELISKPIFSPTSITISNFIKSHSKLKETDNLNLIAELFLIYKKHKKSDENFDDFYTWGEMILSDFDDIDKYLVDAKDLFQNIKSLKEIESYFENLSPEQIEIITKFWYHVNPEKLGLHKDQFISLWSKLNTLYDDFKSVLKQRGIGYEGMIYRDAVENILSHESELDSDKYIFIGFNALNKCEDQIMAFLKKKDKAIFYWDYDTSFTEPKYHEGGFFIRENLRKYPPQTKLTDESCFLQDTKNITLENISSDIGQAKLIHSKLKQDDFKPNPDEPDHTAIVLADESLLIPSLNSIPENINEINITMGFPIMESPAYSLIEILTTLQENGTTSKDGNTYFYYKDVISLIEHQYLSNFSSAKLSELKNSIILHNYIRVPSALFKEIPFWQDIFVLMNSSDQFILYIKMALEKIITAQNEYLSKSNAEVQKEFIYHLYTKLNTLIGLIATNKLDISIKTFLKLFKKIVKSISIPFEGKPLQGLQVMGLMETRALDFENVILLSVNEGKLPKIESAPTFIPHNLRKAFELPTIQHQNSIFAYYFYRLLKRAKNISLVYNSKQEFQNTGEKSRFVHQLGFETEFIKSDKSIGFELLPNTVHEIKVEKNKEIVEKLETYLKLEKPFSPSALINYMSCSLKFYYRYIAGIKEPDEIMEEIEPNMFGSILHRAMELIYTDYINKELNSEQLKHLLEEKEIINTAIDNAFKQEFFKIKADKKVNYKGRNILVRDIIEKYIRQMIRNDLKIAPFTIKGLEINVKHEYNFDKSSASKKVLLGGNIDRVDLLGNYIRIIDYKTGNADTKFSKIENLFTSNKENKKKAIFQTFLYTHIYQLVEKQNLALKPIIYLTKDIFNDSVNPEIQMQYTIVDNYTILQNEFTEYLDILLQEIFNPEIDFKQTESENICQYCEYNKLCFKN